MGGEAHRDGAAVGVAENDGAVQLSSNEEALDELGGDVETGVDVAAALGVSGTGKIEGEDVDAGMEFFHQRNEGLRATHEAMEEEERRLCRRRPSLFEEREAKAVDVKLAAFDHGCRIFLFRLWQVQVKIPWTGW